MSSISSKLDNEDSGYQNYLLFKRFIRWHTPTFRKISIIDVTSGEPDDVYYFCNNQPCNRCFLNGSCPKGASQVTLNEHWIEVVKNKFPEYFI